MRKEVLLGITTAFVLLAGLSTHVALAQNMTTNASNAMGNATEKCQGYNVRTKRECN